MNWPPHDLEDCNEPKARNGRPTAEILDRYTQKCKSKSEGSTRFRCKLSGCLESWAAPRNGVRVLDHIASSCPSATQDDKDAANKHLSSTALAAQVEDMDERSERSTISSRKSGGINESEVVSGTPSVAAIVRREGVEQLNTRFNSAVLRFICAGNLPPSIVKLREWHDMISIANSVLKTLSATTFSDSAIPKEAAYVLEKTYEHLRKGRNHTLTFDGATTRYPQSVYTVHVTTAKSREAYLVAGNEASTVAHTGEHLRDVLVPVGPCRILGPCSFPVC